MRYRPLPENDILNAYKDQLKSYYVIGNSATSTIIRDELKMGLSGLLNTIVPESDDPKEASLFIGTVSELERAGVETGTIGTINQWSFEFTIICFNVNSLLLYCLHPFFSQI